MATTKLPTEVGHKKGSFNQTTPKREPLPRTWFMSRGYSKADPQYTKGHTVWLHPVTNDVLNQYGQKVPLRLLPYDKYLKTKAKYLTLTGQYGSMYLARLKYLTFKGEIKPDEEVDHIDGNPLNNNILNLRAVKRAINRRDGGFMRKLRNKGINIAMFPGIILEGYERMAKWKATHTEWQYRQLGKKDRNELLRIFIGPQFTIVRPSIVDDFPEL